MPSDGLAERLTLINCDSHHVAGTRGRRRRGLLREKQEGGHIWAQDLTDKGGGEKFMEKPGRMESLTQGVYFKKGVFVRELLVRRIPRGERFKAISTTPPYGGSTIKSSLLLAACLYAST